MQLAINLADVDLDLNLYLYMVLLGHNELTCYEISSKLCSPKYNNIF